MTDIIDMKRRDEKSLKQEHAAASALTSKQEGFCQSVVKGASLTDAYKEHYSTSNMKPETINRAGKAVIDNPKISTRIAELRAPAVEKCLLTHTEHLTTLTRLRNLAAKKGQFGAAIKAEECRGRAAGLYVQKVEHTGELKMTGVLRIGGDVSMEEWLKATGGTATTESC